MLTPGDGVKDYEPLTELDNQLDPYDDPVQLYLKQSDAAYFAIGRPKKARYRLDERLDTLQDRYPDTYFDLPVNDKYDESLIYTEDHHLDHEDCWVTNWTFRYRDDIELGSNEYILAIKTQRPYHEEYNFALYFEFAYQSDDDPKQIDAPFDNIEFQYDGTWREYNQTMSYLTEQSNETGYPLSPEVRADIWPEIEPLEGLDDYDVS